MKFPAHYFDSVVARSGGGDPRHRQAMEETHCGQTSPPGQTSRGVTFGSHWIGEKSAVVLPAVASDSNSSPPSRLLHIAR
jgi:hypothetical protein